MRPVYSAVVQQGPRWQVSRIGAVHVQLRVWRRVIVRRFSRGRVNFRRVNRRLADASTGAIIERRITQSEPRERTLRLRAGPNVCSRTAPCCFVHSQRRASGLLIDSPSLVNRYSTRGGMTGNTTSE